MTEPAVDDAQRVIGEAFARGGWLAGQRLPAHYRGCYGCGPDNDHGLGLEVEAAEDDQGVRASYVFTERFQGAAGYAHGGAIAALVDDLFGFVLVRVLLPAVTHELSITYHRPVQLGVDCELHARLDSRDERRLRLSATLVQNGKVAVDSTALFVTVDPKRLVPPPSPTASGQPM